MDGFAKLIVSEARASARASQGSDALPDGRASDTGCLYFRHTMSRNVIAVVDDLFFASKIRGTAEQLAVTVRFVKTCDEVITASIEPPALIIADLHSQRCDPIQLAQQIKSNPRLRAVPLLGFFSHVETELKRQAEEAGFDRVIPRSVFSNDLSKILRDAAKQEP